MRKHIALLFIVIFSIGESTTSFSKEFKNRSNYLFDLQGPVVFSKSSEYFKRSQLVADPDVLMDGDEYKMYVTLSSSNEAFGVVVLGLATSSDGQNFKFIKTEENPVIKVDQPYENYGVETVAVIKHKDKYNLYYTTYKKGEPGVGFICLAESNDGINFEKKGPILDATLPFEKSFYIPFIGHIGGVLEHTVIYNPKSALFELYYNAFGLEDASFWIFDGKWSLPVGRATSKNGTDWKKSKTPIIYTQTLNHKPVKAVAHPDIILVNGLYIMAYLGKTVVDGSATDDFAHEDMIRIAFSKDGNKWINSYDNIAAIPGMHQWDNVKILAPSLVLDKKGIVHMYYWAAGKKGDENEKWSIIHTTKSLSELKTLYSLLDK